MAEILVIPRLGGGGVSDSRKVSPYLATPSRLRIFLPQLNYESASCLQRGEIRCPREFTGWYLWMQKSGRGSTSLSQIWSERIMWTTDGHVIFERVQDAGYVLRLLGLKCGVDSCECTAETLRARQFVTYSDIYLAQNANKYICILKRGKRALKLRGQVIRQKGSVIRYTLYIHQRRSDTRHAEDLQKGPYTIHNIDEVNKDLPGFIRP